MPAAASSRIPPALDQLRDTAVARAEECLGLLECLAAVPDPRSPRGVRHHLVSIADHMRTELVADALRMARDVRGSLAGSVFHSDHGAQYTSKEFAAACSELGVTRSMGAVGTSADNAAYESFHASLKRETLQGAARYDGARSCRQAVFRWLTRYNTRRRHSANGQLSPVVYERRQQQTSAILSLAA